MTFPRIEALAVTVLVVVTGVASGQAQAQADKGQQVFAAQKCSICHSVAGEGNKKGPLDGVGAKLSAAEVRQWITNAPEMAAKAKSERKPPMKAFAALPKDELDALVAYVESLKK
ncbi:MAG: cytochrome c [Acidobacteria bacterium]|nr:cytochrome c [Acidobacteriota bacterium]